MSLTDRICVLSYRCPSKSNDDPWKEIRVKVRLSALTLDGFRFTCPNCFEETVVKKRLSDPDGWNIRYGFESIGWERIKGKMVPKEDKYHQGPMDFSFVEDVTEVDLLNSKEVPC